MGDKTTGVEALSQRQKEILRLISQHLQAKEVARMLNISERTVKTHTEEARKRLGVASSRDAARLLQAWEVQAGIAPALQSFAPPEITRPESRKSFRQRLDALNSWQWVGLIALTALGSAFLVGALAAVLLGLLEIIQQITHYFGWK